jgi:hypothetical protein
MFVDYESVCVDSPYSTALELPKVDLAGLAGGDVDIFQTKPVQGIV